MPPALAGRPPDTWRAAPSGSLLQPLLLVVLATFMRRAQAQAEELLCRPLEGLPLSQPYPPPYFVPGGLPLCSQYTCSCCNRTHALSLLRSLRGALEDPSFSRSCAAWLTRMACRVCDPEVGVGLKPAVCGDACDQWHDACKDEYFSFGSPATGGGLLPCTDAAGGGTAGGGSRGRASGGGAEPGGPLLCSRLGDAVASGRELCEEAGLAVLTRGSAGSGSDDDPAERCFDGSPAYSTDMCAQPPARAATRGGGQHSDEQLSPPVYILAVAVLASLVWLGWGTRQTIMAKEDERMRQLHWRQLQRQD